MWVPRRRIGQWWGTPGSWSDHTTWAGGMRLFSSTHLCSNSLAQWIMGKMRNDKPIKEGQGNRKAILQKTCCSSIDGMEEMIEKNLPSSLSPQSLSSSFTFSFSHTHAHTPYMTTFFFQCRNCLIHPCIPGVSHSGKCYELNACVPRKSMCWSPNV